MGNQKPYTPNQFDVCNVYVSYYMENSGKLHSEAEAEFARFIDHYTASVRRDAERERDEARRIARHARQLKRDEEDHRMEVEAQVVRLEAQSETRRLDIAYWTERAKMFEAKMNELDRAYVSEHGQRSRAENRIRAVEDAFDAHNIEGFLPEYRLREALEGGE